MADSANATNGIYSRIAAALGRASANSKFTTAMLDTLYVDIRPIVSAVGRTVDILVPNVNIANAKNIGSGGLVPNVTAHGNVPLTITQKISNTYPLPTEIDALSEVDLESFYFGPWLEETLRAVNQDVMNVLVCNAAPTAVGQSVVKAPLSSTSNYANVVPGDGDKHPSRLDLANATGTMFQAGAPLSDNYILTSGRPYFAMTADPAYSQSYFVGEAAAVKAQQEARLVTMSGATVLADQQFPVGGTEQAPVYYSLLFNKYAHGARFITEAPVWNQTSKETTIYPKGPGIPVRVSYFFDPMQQASFISFNVVYGTTVLRNDWRSLIVND